MFFGSTSITNQVNPRGSKDTPTVLKALYIYNFAMLTDWPSDYRRGDFVIGVYSKTDNIYNELEKKYRGKKIGSQYIRILKYSSINEINKANILFLDKSKSHLIENVKIRLKNKSTLLITNQSGFLNKGSVINFIEVNSKQSYEISLRNAKRRKLVIASELEKLAHKIIR